MKKYHKSRVYVALWVLLGSLALGQLGRFTPIPGLTIYLHDIIIMSWISVVLFRSKEIRNKLVSVINLNIFTHKKIELLTLVALGSSTLVQVLLQPEWLPIAYMVRLIMYLCFITVLRAHPVFKRLPVYSMLAATAVVIACNGLLQYSLLPDTRFLFVLGFDDHYYRLIGTQFDPAITGALLLLGFLYLHLTVYSKNHRYIFVSTATFLLIALIFTLSRATYLGLGVGLVGLLVTKKCAPRLVLWYIVVSVLTLGIALSRSGGEGTNLGRTASIQARATQATLSLPQSAKEWLVGRGLFYESVDRRLSTTHRTLTITTPNQAKISDNIFLFILTSGGIIGVLLCIAVLIKYILILSRSNPNKLLLVIPILILTQFNNILLQPFVILFFLVGLSAHNE